MKQYEYFTATRHLYDEELNELGLLGWRLISHSAVFADSINQYYVFIREKEQMKS